MLDTRDMNWLYRLVNYYLMGGMGSCCWVSAIMWGLGVLGGRKFMKFYTGYFSASS